jgi:hypothetical protein
MGMTHSKGSKKSSKKNEPIGSFLNKVDYFGQIMFKQR